MRISKQRRQIRKLVRVLFGRYDVSAVYAGEIADCLKCSLEMVEEELGLLYEEGILEPFFELRCCLCGGIIATHESPHYLIGGMAAECPHCLCQCKYDSKNDLVSAWAVRKDEDELDADGAASREKSLSPVTA